MFEFLFFCYIRNHKYLKCIIPQSTSIPLFCVWIFFRASLLAKMKDDVAIPDMNRKFLFDFSTIMLELEN